MGNMLSIYTKSIEIFIVAEFERGVIRERTLAGPQATRASGRTGGRPRGSRRPAQRSLAAAGAGRARGAARLTPWLPEAAAPERAGWVEPEVALWVAVIERQVLDSCALGALAGRRAAARAGPRLAHHP